MAKQPELHALFSKEIYRKLIYTLLIDEGLSNKAIAARLGVSDSAISQRKSKLQELGLIQNGRVILGAIRRHRVATMLFKLKLGNSTNVTAAVQYFQSLDFVLKVTKLASEDFDLRVDYIVFPDDEYPEDANSGSRYVEKAQRLKEVPILIQNSCRFHEEQCVFDNPKRYIDLLVGDK